MQLGGGGHRLEGVIDLLSHRLQRVPATEELLPDLLRASLAMAGRQPGGGGEKPSERKAGPGRCRAG